MSRKRGLLSDRTGRGFTVAEILIALGLVVTALLVLVGVFGGGLNLMANSQEHTVAVEQAKEFLESIEEGGGFAMLPTTAKVFDGSVPDSPESGFPPAPYPVVAVDGRSYVLTVRVEPHPTLAEVTAVEVEVRWGERGRTRLETSFRK